MNQLIPGVYYVKRISGNHYKFEYWKASNMPVSKDLTAVIPVHDVYTYDFTLKVIDESLEANGFVDRMAYYAILSLLKN